MTSQFRFFLYRFFCLFALLSITAIANANEWRQVTVPMIGVENYAREVCVEFQAGDRVQYRFDSEHMVNFNIHYHPDGGTSFKIRQDQITNTSSEFTSEVTQRYCFTWTNTEERGDEWDLFLHYLVTPQ